MDWLLNIFYFLPYTYLLTERRWFIVGVRLFISCIIYLVIISSRISLVKLKFRRVLLLSQLRQRSLPIDIAIKFRLLFLSQVVVEISATLRPPLDTSIDFDSIFHRF